MSRHQAGEGMDIDFTTNGVPQGPYPQAFANIPIAVQNTQGHGHREIREIPVKVHVRRPDRDNWAYLGRAIVSCEMYGNSGRVEVRAANSNKMLTVFNEASNVNIERRGNFVVVQSVDGSRVVGWSLNALNNSDTLRLVSLLELACYKTGRAVADPRSHNKSRRRIERVIKEDRRKRHRRRKDQEAMIDAFSRQTLDDLDADSPSPPSVPSPAQVPAQVM